MKKKRDINVTVSLITLDILGIDIILAYIAQLKILGLIMFIIFVLFFIWIICYIKRKEKRLAENKKPLEKIEKTIIIKLDDLNSDKIALINNEKDLKVINDTSENIEQVLKKDTVTKEYIEDELSKTIFVTDLKAKMKKYEDTIEEEKEKQEKKELKELQKLIKERKND